MFQRKSSVVSIMRIFEGEKYCSVVWAYSLQLPAEISTCRESRQLMREEGSCNRKIPFPVSCLKKDCSRTLGRVVFEYNTTDFHVTPLNGRKLIVRWKERGERQRGSRLICSVTEDLRQRRKIPGVSGVPRRFLNESWGICECNWRKAKSLIVRK